MRVHQSIAARGRKSASTNRTLRRFVPAAFAVLLIGAAGASAPSRAENAAPILIPVALQSSQFASAFAPFDTIATAEASSDEATAEEPKSRTFQDPGQSIGGGTASWYGREFAGRKTASGERFDPGGYTAAHRSLPFGSKVRVTYVATGKSVIVRINDRGPFSRNRVIDVSQAAARELGIMGAGSGKVSLSVVSD